MFVGCQRFVSCDLWRNEIWMKKNVCRNVVERWPNANRSRKNCNDNSRDNNTIKIDCIKWNKIWFVHKRWKFNFITMDSEWSTSASELEHLNFRATICQSQLSNTNYGLSISSKMSLSTKRLSLQRVRCVKKPFSRCVGTVKTVKFELCEHMPRLLGRQCFHFRRYIVYTHHRTGSRCGSDIVLCVASAYENVLTINYSRCRLWAQNFAGEDHLYGIYQYFDHNFYIIRRVLCLYMIYESSATCQFHHDKRNEWNSLHMCEPTKKPFDRIVCKAYCVVT